MKRIYTKVIQFLAAVFLSVHYAIAQNNDVEMADTMRSNGKIYVVVVVLVVILIGIVFYLYSMDRQTKRLEKQINEISDNN